MGSSERANLVFLHTTWIWRQIILGNDNIFFSLRWTVSKMSVMTMCYLSVLTISEILWRVIFFYFLPWSLILDYVRNNLFVPSEVRCQIFLIVGITSGMPLVCVSFMLFILTLILLTWRIWWAPNNASRWQMAFNSSFKGLSVARRVV